MRLRRGLRALKGGTGALHLGESGAVPPKQGDVQMLYPTEAKYPDLHEETIITFSDLQLELVACESCGDYHPPELHSRLMTPFDADEPEEA